MKRRFKYQNVQFNKEFNLFLEKNKSFLSNPIIKEFLKEEEHLRLLMQSVCLPSEENNNKLNVAFKQFYAEIRLIKYFSTFLYYYSINFDKKNRRNRDRFALILDQPLPDNDNETSKDLISSKILTTSDTPESLDDNISQFQLYQALKSLTPKQKKIIELAYVKELTDTEIAKLLGVSQQNISKTRKNALTRLRNYLERDET